MHNLPCETEAQDVAHPISLSKLIHNLPCEKVAQNVAHPLFAKTNTLLTYCGKSRPKLNV
jgi:hypothetical protein